MLAKPSLRWLYFKVGRFRTHPFDIVTATRRQSKRFFRNMEIARPQNSRPWARDFLGIWS
jgi:hypothetical protein